MLGTVGYAVGAGALGLGLYGAGLRLRPLPGWGKPRFLRLSLNLYALQLFVWSLVHRGDAAALDRDRRSGDARARSWLRRLRHPEVAELDEVQALASAYWLIVALAGAGLVLVAALRDLVAG